MNKKDMPERPLDCTECKKPIAVMYSLIIGEKMTRTVMCADCPHLEKRLFGKIRQEGEEGISPPAELVCGNCGTTLEQVRMGQPLGCSECYDVFADVLIDELVQLERISRHFTANVKTQPIHMGRAPGEVTEVSPTLRLIALNEALDETLIREDYEQAALLRDQIKALKDKAKEDERKK